MYEKLKNKAERIFKGNVYKETKYAWGKYRMISPGGKFAGVWNWDSAFHAIGMTYFDCELAKEQILGFLQFQIENGMLPDVVWENGEIEDNFSKPPVMAYAAARVFEKDRDLEFLEEAYEKLVKNEKFWVEKRCVEGLFHYDVNDPDNCGSYTYTESVGYESGWDNSPRWDTNPQNYWAIDLNCFMVLTYTSLAYMADALGKSSECWTDKANKLSQLIEEKLWNDDIKAYTDYNFVDNISSEILTPASFMPLFTGISSKDRAECMNKIAIKNFLPGMPTVSYNHPSYSTDYWRGPCWLNVAYFAAKGLKDYGFDETAQTIRSTILKWVYEDGEFIHENYDAITGEGLCVNQFSWSCVFVLEFIENF